MAKATKKPSKKASKTGAKKTTAKKKAATSKKKPAAAKPKATTAKKPAAKKKATTAKKKATTAKKKPAAKQATPAKKTTTKSTAGQGKETVQSVRAAPGKSAAAGKQLVIVESPAKAKTINKYLGDDFVVRASVGHIRDLPSRSPKGTKQPVPGVDLENDFAPTYEILSQKTKTVAELKRDAKGAKDIWFATDLDREGEAIAWHLASVLDVDPEHSKRVVFNAITRDEIQRAFSKPRPIDVDKVNAQQARRILDRIVGYLASPLLWKKVARGLSAGRVQSVAVRMVVEREREIEAHVPDESWRVEVRLASDVEAAPKYAKQWQAFLGASDDKGKGPNKKRQNQWMAEHAAIVTELHELAGERFKLGCKADQVRDLSRDITAAAEAVGLRDVAIDTVEDPEGKGPARFVRTVRGTVDFAARYAVRSIETKRSSTNPSPPFITSTLQMAAATQLGFSAQRTMRLAQDLYEGVELAGEGQVGLISYMRTDSTHLSPEAIEAARGYIGKHYGDRYLPKQPKQYSSSNKDAQEAHEAIRPTEVGRDPEAIREVLRGPRAEEHYKLYKLIWSRFVGCQMMPAQWDSTSVLLHREDQKTGAVLKASGRVLAFEGFYKATGVPTASDEQTLPEVQEGHVYAPFQIEPQQRFSSPPPRYSEASLVKALESEGIGRPSTYASIIQVIQNRNYVEQRDRRFHATDLGEVVTDKMIEAFPDLMDVGYTRQMEAELDQIEETHIDWVAMLRRFYSSFSASLEEAHEGMAHAKAEIQPAIYKCPKCGSRTCYRFGRNGRFLSCTAYPDCDYAAPIDRRGRPLLPERVDVRNPEDGSAMELRNGRFGPFLASVNYPVSNFVLNLDRKAAIKYPSVPPLVVPVDEVEGVEIKCEKCDAPLNLRRGKKGPWLGCSRFPKCRGRMAWKKIPESMQTQLEAQLEAHERENPVPKITRQDGSVIPEGTPVANLLIQGGVAELEIHPEAVAEFGPNHNRTSVAAARA